MLGLVLAAAVHFNCYAVKPLTKTHGTSDSLGLVCPYLEPEGTKIPENWVQRWDCVLGDTDLQVVCTLMEEKKQIPMRVGF